MPEDAEKADAGEGWEPGLGQSVPTGMGTGTRDVGRKDQTMPEGMNVEIAHKLSENESPTDHHKRWHELLELAEVLILAVVAVTTAWTGLQAAKWDSHASLLYGQASTDRFQADAASTLAGLQLSADASMFTGWLQARASGNRQLQDIYVRRFTPDYRAAYEAWLKTDPFTNPTAPPGPAGMPSYHNPNQDAADRLNAQAAATFEHGTEARETADRYVRNTVLLAAVLFLVAVAQRFTATPARIAVGVTAVGLLTFVVVSLAQLPRL